MRKKQVDLRPRRNMSHERTEVGLEFERETGTNGEERGSGSGAKYVRRRD